MTPAAPILLCAFEPFGGESINGSGEVARALHGRSIDGVPVVGLELPCVFGRSLEVLQQALQGHGPQLVLALGQAGGRCDVTVERVAINVNDARIADNAGARPIDTPVIAGAPAAYFSTLPIKAIVAELRSAGLPASVSQTAGTYVCNHVFFGLMHQLASQPGRPPVRGGFMHLPLLPEQAARMAGQPSLPLTLLVDAVAMALHVALTTHEDLRQSDGALA
jgi:pyroglutamyl-peptidase